MIVNKYLYLTCLSWRVKAMVHNSRNGKIGHFWCSSDRGRAMSCWRRLAGWRLLRQSGGDHESPNFGPQLVELLFKVLSWALRLQRRRLLLRSCPSVDESATHRLGATKSRWPQFGAGLTAQNVDGLVSKNEQQQQLFSPHHNRSFHTNTVWPISKVK